VFSQPEHSADAGEADAKSIRRRAVRGFSWAAISFGSNKFLVFISTLVLTRLLAPADFGVVAAGLTVIGYLEVTLDLGMSAAIVYQQEQGQSRSVAVAFTTNIMLCTVLAALNFLAAPTVASFFRVPDSTAIFRALSIYILMRGVGALQTALLQRDLRFREKAAADVARALVRGGLGVVLALGGLQAWALIWALIVAEAVGIAVAWRQTRFRPRLAFDRATAVPMLRFGAPVAALQLLSELAGNSDYLVVGHKLGSEALGFYSIAYRLPELLLSNVYWIFSSIAFPIFSKARTAGGAAFRGSMLKALRLITMFGFPVSVGMALVSRDAVLVLFGQNWAHASTPMALISLAIGTGSVGYASGDIFKAAGRPGLLLWINGISTMIMLAGFVFAAPYGIGVVALVHLCFNLLYAVVRLALANRFTGTTMRDVLTAIRPAMMISVGIALLGLPVRLLAPSGQWALAAIVAAGIAGAGVGLIGSGRGTAAEFRELAGDLISSRR
jgi:lipopolysaccharide exporter